MKLLLKFCKPLSLCPKIIIADYCIDVIKNNMFYMYS